MRLKFLMRLQQINVRSEVNKNERVIWQVLAENSFEKELLDYIDRFFEIETINDVDGVLTVLDNEMVYHSTFLRENFIDPDFLDIVALGFINERGGILETSTIYNGLEKIKEFSQIPSSKSGVTFSKKTFSEFYKE